MQAEAQGWVALDQACKSTDTSFSRALRGLQPNNRIEHPHPAHYVRNRLDFSYSSNN